MWGNPFVSSFHFHSELTVSPSLPSPQPAHQPCLFPPSWAEVAHPNVASLQTHLGSIVLSKNKIKLLTLSKNSSTLTDPVWYHRSHSLFGSQSLILFSSKTCSVFFVQYQGWDILLVLAQALCSYHKLEFLLSQLPCQQSWCDGPVEHHPLWMCHPKCCFQSALGAEQLG